MAVFQTDGEPPSNGRSIRANMGCTRKSRAEPVKIVTAKSVTMNKANVSGRVSARTLFYFGGGVRGGLDVRFSNKSRTLVALTQDTLGCRSGFTPRWIGNNESRG